MRQVPVDPDAPTKRESERSANRLYLALFVGALIVVAAWCLIVGMRAAHGDELHDVRLAKARVIVEDLYPDSGMYPWLGTLIREHEKYGDEGFAAAWWYSLVYGGANFGLKVGATAPGSCSGPLDVKSTSAAMHQRMRTDTRAHIAHHVGQMWTGWKRGYRGQGLCRYTFLPSRPREWGGGKFRKTDAKHRAVIAKAYQEGRLP
jgi:hypothetical protein